MAKPGLSEIARRLVAAQLTTSIRRPSVNFAREVAPLLAESYPVYFLGADRLGDDLPAFEDRLRDTRRWHHQIHSADGVRQYARSTSRNGHEDDQEVVSTPESLLPARLDETIKWIDTNIPDASSPGLVLAPAYQLAAVWIKTQGHDGIVICSMPAIAGLELNRLYTADEFTTQLKENPPLSGLSDDRQ